MLCNLINYDNDESELEDKCSNLKDELRMCEIVEEMYQRGISFAPIDINSSHATDFIKIGSNIILPPLNVIDGITDQVARVITCSREEKPIKSRNDLLSRMQIGYVTLVNLDKYGLLDNIPEDYQMNIFDIIDSCDSEGADD